MNYVIMDVHGFPGFNENVKDFEEIEAENPVEAANKYLAKHGISRNLQIYGSKNNIHFVGDGDGKHTEKVALYAIEQ